MPEQHSQQISDDGAVALPVAAPYGSRLSPIGVGLCAISHR